MAAAPGRRAALAKIHVAKKMLRLSDELYRAIIARVTGGKRSSALLDTAERGRLLDELRRLGFPSDQPRRRQRQRNAIAAITPASAAPVVPATDDAEAVAHAPHGAAQARKIHTLWRKLAAAAKLRDPSARGLRHFVRRQTGRDALEWLTAAEANKVIEGLKAWRHRVANSK